ncbi:hypothetical protein HDV62DRAFT_238965 [Trichoderma sp. SZMC 28011]
MGVVDFWYLQKCHVNDSLVHTWHSTPYHPWIQWPKYSTRCTVHLLSGTEMQGPGSAYNPTSTACTVLTADASHHGQDKPSQLLRKRQNIHSFKHTVSLLACQSMRQAPIGSSSYKLVQSSPHLISSHREKEPPSLILYSSSSYTQINNKKTPQKAPPISILHPSIPLSANAVHPPHFPRHNFTQNSKAEEAGAKRRFSSFILLFPAAS